MEAYLIGGAIGAVVFAVIGFVSGVTYRKKKAEGILGSAEKQATQMLNEAVKNAEAKKKEILVEAKDEIFQMRNETEKELRERRKEVQRSESRLQQKEETLDKKLDNMEQKEERLSKREKEVEARFAEAEEIKKRQFDMLERISGYTKEQAKEYLLKNLEEELLCTCYNVSENEVRRVITENQLTTVEEVTNYTKAGGGCGRCKTKIQAILDEINKK